MRNRKLQLDLKCYLSFIYRRTWSKPNKLLIIMAISGWQKQGHICFQDVYTFTYIKVKWFTSHTDWLLFIKMSKSPRWVQIMESSWLAPVCLIDRYISSWLTEPNPLCPCCSSPLTARSHNGKAAWNWLSTKAVSPSPRCTVRAALPPRPPQWLSAVLGMK